MTTSIFFLLGLVGGSFLNVVIFRLNKERTFLKGRSFCPQCKNKIAWHDNIPLLSFLLLSGRCRQCQKSISWQYPLVELATAIIFAWLYLSFGLSIKFFIYLILSCFLIIIFIYDLKHYLILDKVVGPAMVIAFLANLYLGLGFWNLIFGALIGGSFFALQFYLSKGKWVGGGDIRLGALMGLILGWKILLVALFLAYLIGAGFGLILIALNKKKMSSQVPFGPFLAAATFISLIYGPALLKWYLNLIYY
jgi:prepilin signal peptidase PulO-like enzyme (type II secretory pathway)